jgi:purine-cytosine permease-like protein
LARIRFGKYAIDLPRSRALRIAIGVLLILGGVVGFLPVLGFWMVPLGFMVLAADFPAVRRLNRRVSIAVMRWWRGRKAKATPGDA